MQVRDDGELEEGRDCGAGEKWMRWMGWVRGWGRGWGVGFSREAEPEGRIYIYRKTYDEELAHGITETQMSPDLLSLCWKSQESQGEV